MGEFQGKQLHELLQALVSTSPNDTLQVVAQKLDQQGEQVNSQIQETISNSHPYIEQASNQLLDFITPQLQAFMLVACQQAVEKGHQAAMVQQQDDEDEQLNAVQTELTLLKKQLGEHQLKLAAEQKENSEKTEVIAQLTEKAERFAKTQDELAEMELQYQDSATDKKQLLESLNELQQQKKDLESQVKQVEHALNRQKEHNELQSTKLKQLIDKRNEENELNNGKYQEVEEALKLETVKLKTENSEMQQSLEYNLELVEKQNKMLDELESQVTELQNDDEEKSLTIERLQQLGETLSSSEDSAKKNIEQLKAQLENLNKEIAAAKEKIDSSEKNNEILKLENDKNKKEQQLLSENLDKLQNTEINLNKNIETLEAENKKLLEQAESNVKKHEGRFNDLKKDLSEEAKQLRIDLNTAEENIALLAAEKQEFTDEIAKLKEQGAKFEKSLSEAQSLVEEQTAALDFAQGRHSSIKSRQEDDSKKARAAYEEMRTKNIELTDKIDELEAKVTEFKLKFEYAQKQLAS